MLLAIEITAIVFMFTFIFIGIWSFVILKKAYSQLKYKNYILEKIDSHISLLNNIDSIKSTNNFENKNINEEK